MATTYQPRDENYQYFIERMAALMKNNAAANQTKYASKKRDDIQKQQFEKLIALEAELRARLPDAVYVDFVKFITEEIGNILQARPYFRERQDTFTKEMSPVFRGVTPPVTLRKFAFNYQFVQFYVKRFQPPPAALALVKQIEGLRRELIEDNLPLVVNRVGIFTHYNKPNHQTIADFVGMGVLGLIGAVDKFCLPYRSVWRSVAIGGMVGRFIEAATEPQIYLGADDKRRAYRANKVKRLFAGDIQKITDYVNGKIKNPLDPEADALTADNATPEEVADVIAASSSYVALSVKVSSGSGGNEIHEPEGAETDDIDGLTPAAHIAPSATLGDELESREIFAKLGAAGILTPLEIKFLRLKGIQIWG